jgi:two-component system OmpR family sensor kinase
LVADAQLTIGVLPGKVDSLTAARAVGPRLIDPALLLVVIGNVRRVTVLRPIDGRGGSSVAIIVRPRTDRSGEPQAHGVFGRFLLGLATVVGLPIARAKAKGLDLYATENQTVFVADVGQYVPAIFVAVAAACILGFLAARILSREAFRPLVEVTRALERFSAGDFTPEMVEAGRDRQFGALANAYNGAVAQVERSFAERARANASIRQFIADASHQLRTPLTVIRGFVSILRQNANVDAETTHILSSMAQQTALMSSLIEKLILLERWEYESPESRATRCDVGALVLEVVAPLALANPAREIRITANPGGYVVAESDDIKHAVTNVVENALNYTQGPIEVQLETGSAEIFLSVRDEGPGMPPDQAEHAFERFYRGWRRDVEGSGLGLAIAQRAVERARGSIALETGLERGTTVRIRLPRAADPN